jgi:hypothetical protein
LGDNYKKNNKKKNMQDDDHSINGEALPDGSQE